jgi:hypothetical protein
MVEEAAEVSTEVVEADSTAVAWALITEVEAIPVEGIAEAPTTAVVTAADTMAAGVAVTMAGAADIGVTRATVMVGADGVGDGAWDMAGAGPTIGDIHTAIATARLTTIQLLILILIPAIHSRMLARRDIRAYPTGIILRHQTLHQIQTAIRRSPTVPLHKTRKAQHQTQTRPTIREITIPARQSFPLTA